MHLQRLLQDQDPDSTALRYAGTALSFGELDHRSRRLAGALLGLGIGPGDRVAVWLPNTPAWLEVFFACSQIGAVAVSVNTRFRAAEVEDILVRSRARLLVLWPRFLNIDFLQILNGIRVSRLDDLERIILYSESGDKENRSEPLVIGCPGISYSSLLEQPPREGTPRSVGDDGVASSSQRQAPPERPSLFFTAREHWPNTRAMSATPSATDDAMPSSLKPCRSAGCSAFVR